MHKHSDASAMLVFICFLVIGAVLIVWEHRAHVAGYALYGFLLLCPLLHLFMHRGHTHGSGGHQ